MTESKKFKAIGLMSGTSVDGIDVAYLESDGVRVLDVGAHQTVPYSKGFRRRLRALIAGKSDRAQIEDELTCLHAIAVNDFMSKENILPNDIDIVGFHGHTIYHDASRGRTLQIGDGEKLSRLLKIPVVSDFRKNDVKHGGQGAPLVPVYHAALFGTGVKPVAVLNIGGIANVTWIGEEGYPLLSFDTGPGNALLDDWIRFHEVGEFDEGGQRAAAGSVDSVALTSLLRDDYFSANPPKSLDRNYFGMDIVRDLALEDGAATLAAFTVRSIGLAAKYFPVSPRRWIVCGGGRKNQFFLDYLTREVTGEVLSSDVLGYNGDAIEAQAFAYLAIRSFLGLPISFPGTTGVAEPLSGGRFSRPFLPDK